jgi:hypothetical protein
MATGTVTTAVVAIVLAAGGSGTLPGGTVPAMVRTAATVPAAPVPAAALPASARAADAPAWTRPVARPVRTAPARTPRRARPAPARPMAKPAYVAPLDPDPYFRTPEAAMRYLALAYNRHDDANLRHVTEPHVREHLAEMRSTATDLRLTKCTKNMYDEYECTFSHAYPRALGRGSAWFVATAVARRGWMMTELEGCG